MISGYSNSELFNLNLLAGTLGYININQLMRENGYSSLDEIACEHGFTNFKEYLNAPGYCCRLEKLIRRRKSE